MKCLRTEYWRSKLYPEKWTQDPVAALAREITPFLGASRRVLDLGAGRGRSGLPFSFEEDTTLFGIDLDTGLGSNPYLHHAVIAAAEELPFSNESFQLVIGIYVFEHFQYPLHVLREVHRVLARGGHFVFLTPNLFHYVGLISLLTPLSFHKWINKKRGRIEKDTFPTYYGFNSRSRMKRVLGQTGFEPVMLRSLEVQPNYLLWSLPTFVAGALYERMVSRFEILSPFRACILGILRKVERKIV
ncbi:MAG TPA: class I SAM-dependent methyltransferase [Acidobacteriota bacterium]|nr:class I SAM-dependent methyltransferase [Acidobacteriota bacterium]